MPGTQAFTRVSMGKETTWGTGVAPTRRFYGVGTGALDPGLSWETHRDAARGVKTRIGRSLTQTGEDPKFKLQSAGGIGYDDLVQILSAGLRGGQTGAGGTADKTWTLVSQNAASVFVTVGTEDPQEFVGCNTRRRTFPERGGQGLLREPQLPFRR